MLNSKSLVLGNKLGEMLIAFKDLLEISRKFSTIQNPAYQLVLPLLLGGAFLLLQVSRSMELIAVMDTMETVLFVRWNLAKK